jgi:hypothetical protein
MTAPYPLPGEFPDFEQFMVDLFTPIATTVTALPATAAAIQSALPLIWVRKIGGTLDANAITYKAQVQAVVFGTTRSQAQQLAIQVRDAILAAPSTLTNGVLVDYVEEISGTEPKFTTPALRRSRGLTDFPDLDPLNQMVEVAFAVEARRQ